MAMNALRQSASGGIGKFILFGFLVLAAGGLVFSDVGGFFRGGVSSTDIAKVGDETISIYEFDRTARRTLSQLNLTTEQAYQYGYLRELLNNEVRGRLLAITAKENDIQFGKDKIASHIQTIIKPMVQEDQTPQEVLEQLLRAQNMSERQLVTSINKDLSVNLLSQGIQGGFAYASNALASDLARAQAETRDVEYILLKYNDAPLANIEQPTDEKLEELYNATKEAYAKPETRKTQLIILDTDKISDTIEISQEELRAEYDDNIERYQHTEARNIEQAIVQKQEVADSIFKAINEGTDLKKAVEDVTGKTTDYIPANDVNEENLLDELTGPIFEAEKPGPLGPVKSPLGYHVMVLDIQPPKTDTFDEVKTDIEKELKAIRVSDARFELSNSLDDLLAGGAAPEEIKNQLDVTIKDLPAFNRFGTGKDDNPVMEDLQDDKAHILEAAFDLNEGEASPVFETTDGKIAALYVQSITEKSYPTFETVIDTLKARWIEDQKRANTKKDAETIAQSITSKEKSFEVIAKERSKTIGAAEGLSRDSGANPPPAPFDPESAQAVFSNAPGEAFTINTEEGVIIAQATSFELPNITKEKREEVANAVAANSKNEGLNMFIRHQNKKINAIVNERLLEQSYAPSR